MSSTASVSEADAQRAASVYVATYIDPALAVVDGAQYYSQPLNQQIWRFFIRCAYGPLYPIQVNLYTGEVIARESCHS
jgi:hypothetical protein